MARTLGDVLHYLLPEAEPGGTPRPGDSDPPADPIVVPVAAADVVRAALLWNLAVELARVGFEPVVLSPLEVGSALLWPAPGRGPLGMEMRACAVSSPEALLATAARLRGSAEGSSRRLVLVRLPPRWLLAAGVSPLPPLTLLLLVRPEARELAQGYVLAKQAVRACARVRLGASVHGVRRVDEARRAFSRLARAVESHLGRPLRSYGLLADDPELCRSILLRRPVGLVRPGSAAARSLADVARWIALDAGWTWPEAQAREDARAG